jgi:hypothetical protein
VPLNRRFITLISGSKFSERRVAIFLEDGRLRGYIPDMNSFRRIICFLAVVLAAIFVIGCSSDHVHPVPPPQPTEEALLIPQDDMDIAWDETLEVLREHYFIPDRQDRREGLIVSEPDLSKMWFEFWRDDAVGRYDITESSVHSIQRIAVVNFVPQGKELHIRVEVTVQRKNQPQRQITTASGSFQVFRDQIPLVMTGRPAEKEDIVTWVDLGKDVRLSNYLLGRIEKRLPSAQVMYLENCAPTTRPSPE